MRAAVVALGAVLALAAGCYNEPAVPACAEDEVVTKSGHCLNREQGDFRDGYWYDDTDD